MTFELFYDFKTGEWELVKFVTRFTSIRLVKQEKFCGAIAFYLKLLRFLNIFFYIFFLDI